MRAKEYDAELNRCYLSSFFKGKSRFAVFLDRIVFSLIASLCFYAALRSRRIYSGAAIFFGITAGLITYLIQKALHLRRLKRHMLEMRKKTRDNIIRRSIILEDKSILTQKIEEICRCGEKRRLIVSQKSTGFTEDDIYGALRELKSDNSVESVVFAGLSDPTVEAKSCAERVRAPHIEFVNMTELAALTEQINASESEIDMEILRSAEKPHKARKPLYKTVFNAPSNKYTMLGALLFAVSLILKRSFYYRIVAAICFAIAFRIRLYSLAASGDSGKA